MLFCKKDFFCLLCFSPYNLRLTTYPGFASVRTHSAVSKKDLSQQHTVNKNNIRKRNVSVFTLQLNEYYACNFAA